MSTLYNKANVLEETPSHHKPPPNDTNHFLSVGCTVYLVLYWLPCRVPQMLAHRAMPSLLSCSYNHCWECGSLKCWSHLTALPDEKKKKTSHYYWTVVLEHTRMSVTIAREVTSTLHLKKYSQKKINNNNTLGAKE